MADDDGGASELRIVAAGRGSTMSNPIVVDTVMAMVGKEQNADVVVVYLGTATFDELEPSQRQCQGFQDAGCNVIPLKVSDRVEASLLPSRDEIRKTLLSSDIILVSGGNTLYAVNRWKDLGIDEFIREASENGSVLCGGSAGAICWFQEGHSQSMNPALALHVPESLTEEEKKSWDYVRVDGLGFLPGLCVPHHDVEQSNGVPREEDSNQMMKEKPDQPCLGIDEDAALVVEGDQVRVVATHNDAGCCVKVCNAVEDASDGFEIQTFAFTEEHGQIPIQQLLTDPETAL